MTEQKILWQDQILQYCDKYSLPIEYLPDVLYEPKVIPMIRGKAFEFSVMLTLQKYLPNTEWEVVKIPSNAQLGIHDVDVQVTHRTDSRVIRVECKLAKNKGLRITRNGEFSVPIKCMRSRTLGKAQVARLAPKLDIAPNVLMVHNDQYLPTDFDVVITSIGNTFYQTNKKTGLYEWKPGTSEKQFLQALRISAVDDEKSLAFDKMYVARSVDIVIGKETGVVCTRKKCKKKTRVLTM
jgi:hypothetical protein